ncbi:amino acid adenylation domain-containing protein, partial [Paenibacillus glucanolyticus]|uniref:amino acid adenylation domain-containing protein n=1 Tax=Paenibacillus glucanolyticus TaxID=59843 RepID=UPI003676F0C8
YQEYPFEELVQRLNPRRDTGRNVIFDTMFLMQDQWLQNLEAQDVKVNPTRFNTGITKYDMTVTVNDEKDRLEVKVNYRKDLFMCQSVLSMMEKFKHVLGTVAIKPESNLKDVELLTNEDINILHRYNNHLPYPYEFQTIHEAFEMMAEMSPHSVALHLDGKELTYSRLNVWSNQIAHQLIGLGLRSEEIVGIVMDKSFEMVAGILGVLKVGGAYLPIDPNYPESRIQYMVMDSGLRVVLTLSKYDSALFKELVVVCLDEKKCSDSKSDNPKVPLSSENLAYVIYTSGTTGRPKGVMVEHRNVLSLFFGNKDLFGFQQTDVWTMFHSFCFDFSVWELFGALLSGGKCVLITERLARTPQNLLRVIRKQNVTIFSQTPTAFYSFVAETQLSGEVPFKYVVLGGEELLPNKLTEWRVSHPHVRLINMYGITETTVHVTYREISETDFISGSNNIGTPLQSLKVFITDPITNKLLPPGIVGEIAIAGEGVARGYLNKENLTRDKFIVVPGLTGKLYKSGDLGRWRMDGSLEYFGRIDSQVKIRGYRIEISEIEKHLLMHPNVADARIIPWKEDGSKHLNAYVVTKDGRLERSELRTFLANALPAYMIPSYFFRVPGFPLTSNGKLDRTRLIESVLNESAATSDTQASEPLNVVQELFVNAWKEVLQLQHVGIHENFFELGGDSIKAIQVSAKLRNLKYKIGTIDIMKYPTIAQLSVRVQPLERTYSQASVTGEVLLTPIQKKLFMTVSDPHIQHYNQSVLLHSNKKLNKELIAQCYSKLMVHHDALRMIVSVEGGTIRQINQGKERIEFSLRESILPEGRNIPDDIEEIANLLHGNMDIYEGPLNAMALFHTVEGDYLLFVIHHLVIDGVSWRILLEDFIQLYGKLESGENPKLQQKTGSFQQWALFLQDYANRQIRENEIDYWKEVVDKVNSISTRNLKDLGTLGEAIKKEFAITQAATSQLFKQTLKSYRVQINDLLVAALLRAYSSVMGTSHMTVNIEGHGREAIVSDIDVSRTIGWFTMEYPIVLKACESSNMKEWIEVVKQVFENVPSRGIGYGLLKYLREDLSFKDVVCDVSFNYLGQFEDYQKAEFAYSVLPTGHNFDAGMIKSYPMEVDGEVRGGQLRFEISYSPLVFSFDQMNELTEEFVKELNVMITTASNGYQEDVMESEDIELIYSMFE